MFYFEELMRAIGERELSSFFSAQHVFPVAALVACIPALLLLALASFRKRTNTSSGAAVIPGPRRYFLGNYLNLAQLSNRRKTMSTVTEWCLNTSGPVMALGVGPLQMVLLLTPDSLQKVFGSSSAAHLGKPPEIYNLLKPVDWFDGIIFSSGDKYKSRRKLINGSVAYASVVRYVPAWNEFGKGLVRVLEAEFVKEPARGPRPIYSFLLDATLASLMKTIFGTDETEDGQDEYRTIEQCLKRTSEIVASRLLKPWLSIEPIYRRSQVFKEQREIFERTLKIVGKRVERHVKEGKLSRGGSGNGEEEDDASTTTTWLFKDLLTAGLSPEGIFEETVSMVTAGYDTTEIALHSTLYFLALHPSIQERARQEVDSVFEDEQLNGDISGSGVAKLEYLEQCLMESLRMLPPALAFARKLGSPLILSEDNVVLPAGTTVGIWSLAIHMNPEYYPNPERFDPDRFSPEERKRRHPYSFLPFSAGPRKCPGYKFATMEILIVIAHILRNFTFSSPDKFENVVWLYSFFLKPETPIRFVFEKRAHNT